MNQRVFVYGTLLFGEPNHALLARARFLTPARTAPAFELWDLGEYPALVHGGSQAVVGEVYEVDAATLDVLDDFEEHPSFYRRTRILLSGGTSAEAYLLRAEQVRNCPRIASGDWRAFRRGS